jgi:microcystin-dependent protein
MMKKTRTSIGIVVLAVALVAGMIWIPPAQASEPFIGQIQIFGFNFAPRGWAHCDGQLLPISSYSALFSLLGTTYGGDGRTTFALPDLRGRVAVHPGSGPGVDTVYWGQRGGYNSVILSASQLPAHSHSATVRASSRQGTEQGPGNTVLAEDRRETQYSTFAPDVDMLSGMVTIGNTGGGQPFSIMQPFLGIYHSIALEGVYPSRN